MPSRKKQRAQGKQKAWKLHQTTDAPISGLGEAAAVRPGKSSSGRGKIWDPGATETLPPGVAAPEVPHTISAPVIEALRLKSMTKLRALLATRCADHGVVEPIFAFERWLFRGRLQDEQYGGSTDVLLPSCRKQKDPRGDPALADDLQRAAMPTKDAEAVSLELCRASTAAAAQVASARKQKHKAVMAVTKHKWTADFPIPLPGGGAARRVLKLNVDHLEKLRELYCGHMCAKDEAGAVAFDEANFHTSVFCVLCRYHALLGHGFQAALSEHGFDVLKRHLGVTLECFASPLNCHFRYYCSAFSDIEAAFGSVGSFFDKARFAPISGSFEANPPFIPELMSAMALRIEELLRTAAGSNKPLSFCIVVPGWTEAESWKLLSRSPFRRARWLVAKEDHGFCDGAQHQRRDRYRESPFDTAVFVLQTDAGAAKWPVNSTIEQKLREAMSEAVPTPAAKARRLRDGRGLADADVGRHQRQSHDRGEAPVNTPTDKTPARHQQQSQEMREEKPGQAQQSKAKGKRQRQSQDRTLAVVNRGKRKRLASAGANSDASRGHADYECRNGNGNRQSIDRRVASDVSLLKEQQGIIVGGKKRRRRQRT